MEGSGVRVCGKGTGAGRRTGFGFIVIGVNRSRQNLCVDFLVHGHQHHRHRHHNRHHRQAAVMMARMRLQLAWCQLIAERGRGGTRKRGRGGGRRTGEQGSKAAREHGIKVVSEWPGLRLRWRACSRWSCMAFLMLSNDITTSPCSCLHAMSRHVMFPPARHHCYSTQRNGVFGTLRCR